MYILNVSYQIRESTEIEKKDSLADKLVGKKNNNNGFFESTKERDLSYEFFSKRELERAKEKLEKAGFACS